MTKTLNSIQKNAHQHNQDNLGLQGGTKWMKCRQRLFLARSKSNQQITNKTEKYFVELIASRLKQLSEPPHEYLWYSFILCNFAQNCFMIDCYFFKNAKANFVSGFRKNCFSIACTQHCFSITLNCLKIAHCISLEFPYALPQN